MQVLIRYYQLDSRRAETLLGMTSQHNIFLIFGKASTQHNQQQVRNCSPLLIALNQRVVAKCAHPRDCRVQWFICVCKSWNGHGESRILLYMQPFFHSLAAE